MASPSSVTRLAGQAATGTAVLTAIRDVSPAAASSTSRTRSGCQRRIACAAAACRSGRGELAQLVVTAGELAGGAGDRPHQVGPGRAEPDVGGDPPGRPRRRLAEVEQADGHADAAAEHRGEPVANRRGQQRPGLRGERSPAVEADDPGVLHQGVREVAAADRRADAVRADQDVGRRARPVAELDRDAVADPARSRCTRGRTR